MNSFGILTVVFALVGAAVYLAIVYFAGKQRLWWLALLITLPAILALITYQIWMPPDLMSQSTSPLLRHFGLVGVVQLLAGVVAYIIGRSNGRADISNKGAD